MRWILALWALFFVLCAQAAPGDKSPDAVRTSDERDHTLDLDLLNRLNSVGSTVGSSIGEVSSRIGEVGTKIGEVGSKIGRVGNKIGEVGSQVQATATELVASAFSFLGVPYRRGGTNADTGFDCSGFVRSVYQQTAGLLLPRRAEQQAAATQRISKADLQPGDLVFFNTMRRAFSHVGIYIGNGKFIHAPKPGAEVRVEDLDLRYWTKRFDGARRVPEEAHAAAAQAAAALSGADVAAPLPTATGAGITPAAITQP